MPTEAVSRSDVIYTNVGRWCYHLVILFTLLTDADDVYAHAASISCVVSHLEEHDTNIQLLWNSLFKRAVGGLSQFAAALVDMGSWWTCCYSIGLHKLQGKCIRNAGGRRLSASQITERQWGHPSSNIFCSFIYQFIRIYTSLTVDLRIRRRVDRNYMTSEPQNKAPCKISVMRGIICLADVTWSHDIIILS